MRKKRQSKNIQTGRALPPIYSSYSPGRRGSQAQPAAEVEEIEKRRSWQSWLLRFVLISVALLLATAIFIGIWDARNISSFSQKLFGTSNIFSLVNSGDLQTDQNGRVNVLVAGYSVDDVGHAGATLTDSILMISMNPNNHTGYLLSIPRDLYVEIPGNGRGKINEAYPDGGMSLLVRTVANVTGMQIPYYVLVDYSAVRDIVNALGGINVTINSPDGRLYDPSKDYSTGGPLVDLSNGTHQLDGQQALDFSRARGDNPNSVGFEQSDFQRTADQRQILMAIKSKLNWKLILNPVKNRQILNALGENIKTNIAAGEARPLFGLFNKIPNSRLQSLSLRNLNGHNYLSSTFYEGETLTPAAGLGNYSDIQDALSQINQQ